MGAYGDISQGHVLADGWNKEENNRTIISQTGFGSAPNRNFNNGYKFVSASQYCTQKDDFYYFHNITGTDVEIYARDVMETRHQPRMRK